MWRKRFKQCAPYWSNYVMTQSVRGSVISALVWRLGNGINIGIVSDIWLNTHGSLQQPLCACFVWTNVWTQSWRWSCRKAIWADKGDMDRSCWAPLCSLCPSLCLSHMHSTRCQTRLPLSVSCLSLLCASHFLTACADVCFSTDWWRMLFWKRPIEKVPLMFYSQSHSSATFHTTLSPSDMKVIDARMKRSFTLNEMKRYLKY